MHSALVVTVLFFYYRCSSQHQRLVFKTYLIVNFVPDAGNPRRSENGSEASESRSYASFPATFRPPDPPPPPPPVASVLKPVLPPKRRSCDETFAEDSHSIADCFSSDEFSDYDELQPRAEDESGRKSEVSSLTDSLDSPTRQPTGRLRLKFNELSVHVPVATM